MTTPEGLRVERFVMGGPEAGASPKAHAPAKAWKPDDLPDPPHPQAVCTVFHHPDRFSKSWHLECCNSHKSENPPPILAPHGRSVRFLCPTGSCPGAPAPRAPEGGRPLRGIPPVRPNFSAAIS